MQMGCIGGSPSGVGSSLFLERVFFYAAPEKSVENYLVNNKDLVLTKGSLGPILDSERRYQ